MQQAYLKGAQRSVKYIPKSPLRYDEYMAIRSEFASYQFPERNGFAVQLVSAHIAIWMVGKLLRMAKKL